MWIFFDEINTCNSMGLLSEIFCNHTYRGKPIPDRYIFIGACNPYRILSDKSKNLEFGLYLKNKKRKNLVYTVNPLPHSLLNYVIDFGELTEKDTELYIESMLKEVIECKDNLLRLAVSLVTKSHLFIKNNNDVSSVSLRDIKYFIIFYKGFIDYFKYLRKLAIEESINKMSNKMKDYKDMSDYAIKEQSIILSIYISYYLRLPTKKLRKELSDKLNNDYYLKSKNDFLNGPLRESNFLLNQISIDPAKGIAKNNALRENIFCEFFCLINKVPLIICGKPGNSKTLSVQLLLDSMKGASSFNDFFKNPDYKEVVTYPFQGSTTCTSKGVIQTFEKARKYAAKNSNMMNVLVFFDEMGLAEDSPTNPLKVLHSELENDENKFAFFGLTNWALDASKMNRGIRICVQEPDEEDLIYTSNEIAKSIDQNIFIENKILFEYLSKSYFKYKVNLSSSGYKDFHGNRDFYNLIRTTMKYLKEENKSIEDNPNKNLEAIQTICAIKAIERNFGGLKNSVNDMKKIFYEISKYPEINHQYNIKECIEDNFRDPNSRYLLLISKNSTSQNLIEHIIKKGNKESAIFIGSQFKGDKSESYTEDILYKIQIQMENNVILTLKGLEIIYPSLYDLFNQNFSEINGNKYAKISFSNNQSTSIVNNGFKVIVLVDDEMITYEDKPFLNRFEKHIISFENILLPKYVDLVKEIDSNLKELIKYSNNNDEKNILGINLKKQLISCDKEIIENMVFNLSNNNANMTDKEIKIKIFEVIAPTLTQDIISCFNINGFKQKEPEVTDIILKSYIKLYSSSISEYLKNIPNILYLRNIIYTFSNITEPIFTGNEIKNEKLGIVFKKETTTEIILDSVDTTNNFEQLINLFYRSQKNLCIIKFEYEDLNKMNNIKNIIDYTEKIESTRIHKFYFFIVYMKRELLHNNANDNEKLNRKIIIKDQIPLMSDFMQITIDNINNPILGFNITNLFINEKNSNIINSLYNVKDLINENIYNILDRMKYKIINKKEEFNLNNYKATISNEIIKNDFLMGKLIEALFNNCKSINEIVKNILLDTKNKYIHKDDIDLLSTIKEYYKNEIILTLTKIIYNLDKNNILSSYILYKNIFNNNFFNKVFDNCIKNMNLDICNIDKEIEIIIGLKIPSIKNIISQLKNYIKSDILEKYSNNEYSLRDYIDENEIKDAENKYQEQKNELIENTFNQIIKINELNDILITNDSSIINAFFNDFYLLFLSEKKILEFGHLIKLLDIIAQIYIIDKNMLNNENDFENDLATKLMNKNNNQETNTFNQNEFIHDCVKVFLFFETYSDYIVDILDIYRELFHYIPEVEEKFIKAYINQNFECEKSERCPEYCSIVNNKIFYIYETTIFIMKAELYSLYEKKSNIEDLLKYIKSIIAKLKQINSHYQFFSKEILTLENIFPILKVFENQEKKSEEDLFIIFNCLEKERNYIKNNNKEELIENLGQIQSILIKNLGVNSDDYSSLFIYILLNQYKIYPDKDHRKNIIEIICSNNNLIKKSIPILKQAIGNIEPDDFQNEEDYDNDNDFLSIFIKNPDDNNYEILEYIDGLENNTLNHTLLYLFECSCENYFYKLKKKYNKDEETFKEKILNINSISFLYFKKAYQSFMKIERNEINDEDSFINLLKLLSIAYIKRYINYYINMKINKRVDSDGLSSDKDINISNNEINQANEIKILKIYMLKLINKKKEINQFPFEEYYLKFLDNFIENYIEDKQDEDKQQINNSFLFNLKETRLFENIRSQIDNIDNNSKNIDQLIDNFFLLYCNKYLFPFLTDITINIIDENIEKQWNEIKDKIINIPQNIVEFFDRILTNDFYNKVMDKIGIVKGNKLDDKKCFILSFALRFIYLSIKNANNNNLFSSLLKKEKYKNIIENSYLPGIAPQRNSIYKKEFREIEKHLNTKKVKEGAYVCSCGLFYPVEPCGFPTQKSRCFNCNEFIGGEDHILVRREGHYRIFLDEKARNSQLSISYADKDMPNMLLNEYKEYVDKKEEEIGKEKEQKLKLVKKEDFIKIIQNNLIRNMDNLTYRIMNFILYSHIFYSNIIYEENFENLSIEEMSIFNILENDWDRIEEIIKDKNNINNINEFMNIIYYILENKIVKCDEIFETKEKRNLYEKEIKDLIEISINKEENEFKILKSNYQENLNNLHLNKKSLKIIVNELEPPNIEEYLSHPTFKYLKFFMISNCPNIDLLKKNIESIKEAYKKYPLLYYILYEGDQIKILQNLPYINQFSNLLLQKYSYNIRRKDAKDKKISDEKESIISEVFNNDKEKFEEIVKKYTECWNQIKDIAIKYSCKDEMKPHEIKNFEDEYLANFLVDDGELYYGMYLASAYEKFIEIENNFIRTLTCLNDDSDSIHKNYLKQLSYKIKVQEADKKDIPKICDEETLNDFINECSIRKCFDKNGIVIYNNYAGINIYIDKIEEKLCEKILLGVKDFKEDDISFITYRFEGYRGQNSAILTKYIEKYHPQRKLITEEINAVFNYIENDYSKYKEYKEKKKTEFLFDLQKLIKYIQNENYKNEQHIKEIIDKMPSITHLEGVKEFFTSNDKESDDKKIHLFTVNSLVDLYNLFEHECWNEIKENINNEYKKKIKEEITNEINKFFEENDDKKSIINKLNLSTAIRRFISKYLSGERGENEVNENNKLMQELKRPDLWDYLFVDHPYFENEIDKIDKKFGFVVGEAMDLYEKLGTDEKLLTKIKESIRKSINKNEADLILKERRDNEPKKDIKVSTTKSNQKKRKGKEIC